MSFTNITELGATLSIGFAFVVGVELIIFAFFGNTIWLPLTQASGSGEEGKIRGPLLANSAVIVLAGCFMVGMILEDISYKFSDDYKCFDWFLRPEQQMRAITLYGDKFDYEPEREPGEKAPDHAKTKGVTTFFDSPTSLAHDLAKYKLFERFGDASGKKCQQVFNAQSDSHKPTDRATAQDAVKAAESVYYQAKNIIFKDPNYFHELSHIRMRIDFSRSFTFVCGVLFVIAVFLMFVALAIRGWLARLLKNRVLATLRIGSSPGFLTNEFHGRITIHGLLNAIKADDIAVPEAATEIEQLNRLLGGSSLYPKFKAVALSKEAERLVARESRLSGNRRMRLNRLLLEAAYPLKCPKQEPFLPLPIPTILCRCLLIGAALCLGWWLGNRAFEREELEYYRRVYGYFATLNNPEVKSLSPAEGKDGQSPPRVTLATDPIPNVGIAKLRVTSFHDSGEWEAETEKITGEAATYLRQLNPAAKKQAVVFDIDDTVLSTWPEIHDNDYGYNSNVFDTWVLKANAKPIVPVHDLYTVAKKRGFAIFFVSGRGEALRAATEKNLRAAGYDEWDGLFLRPLTYNDPSIVSFKASERKRISEELGYTIVLNVGDQESDFIGGWCEKCCKIPNPAYFLP